MSDVNSFTQLIVWQKAHQLVLDVYRATKLFPHDERFGLISQLRRASVSISANIAEGYKRASKGEKKQFFHIASASLEEVRAELLIAQDLQYQPPNGYPDLFEKAAEVSRLLQAWICRFS